jgi:hypothetical protein
MPRPKLPKPKPIETSTFRHNQEDWVLEVWNNRADAETRGAHKLRLRDDVFNAALDVVDKYLNDPSPILKSKYERLLDGSLSRAEFGRTIALIAKSKGLKIGKTLSEEVADDIKKHYSACKNALAAKDAEK